MGEGLGCGQGHTKPLVKSPKGTSNCWSAHFKAPREHPTVDQRTLKPQGNTQLFRQRIPQPQVQAVGRSICIPDCQHFQRLEGNIKWSSSFRLSSPLPLKQPFNIASTDRKTAHLLSSISRVHWISTNSHGRFEPIAGSLNLDYMC